MPLPSGLPDSVPLMSVKLPTLLDLSVQLTLYVFLALAVPTGPTTTAAAATELNARTVRLFLLICILSPWYAHYVRFETDRRTPIGKIKPVYTNTIARH